VEEHEVQGKVEHAVRQRQSRDEGRKEAGARVVIGVVAGLLIVSVFSFGMPCVGSGGLSSVPPLITTCPE
jgi:hypothetical protein